MVPNDTPKGYLRRLADIGSTLITDSYKPSSYDPAFLVGGWLAGLAGSLALRHPDLDSIVQSIDSTDMIPAAIGALALGRLGGLLLSKHREAEHYAKEANRHQLARQKDLEEAKKTSRYALSTILEDQVRDFERSHPQRAKHAQRVAELCRDMGKLLSLTKDELDDLYTAARLCDIGYSKIDPAVLVKSDLDVNDFEEIKKHPVKGAELLEQAGFNDRVCAIVRGSHERYDGSGYPDARQGGQDDEDPLRLDVPELVLHVADAYVSLTEERPHREGMSHTDAMQEIYDGRGTQFDPDVVDLLVVGIFKEKPAQYAGVRYKDDWGERTQRLPEPQELSAYGQGYKPTCRLSGSSDQVRRFERSKLLTDSTDELESVEPEAVAPTKTSRYVGFDPEDYGRNA